MDFLRSGKLRWLYLLALAQLAGGPLVLLHVTVFCKMAVHETPRLGVAKAALKAWKSDDFQSALACEVAPRTGKSGTLPPDEGSKAKYEKTKSPVIPWEAAEWVLADISRHCAIADRERIWTPAWPQAPPGPPPRLV